MNKFLTFMIASYHVPSSAEKTDRKDNKLYQLNCEHIYLINFIRMT